MNHSSFIVNGREISCSQPPYIIAELSANHNGSIERAKESIKVAKQCGANAVKIQTYTPDTMTIDCDKDDFLIKGGLWDNYKLYDLYKEAYTPFEWHEELFRWASDIGITLFSTPFDESAVLLLEKCHTPAYKIASFELQDIDLIAYVARRGKPMFMSTGMASYSEIEEAIRATYSNGCESVVLFHCISNYPTPIEDANLNHIKELRDRFGTLVGLSDHSMGNIAAITSIAVGACVIEKHFTLSRKEQGADSEFSMEPSELKDLVESTNQAWLSMGPKKFIRPPAESSSKAFRRSLYFVTDLKKGDFIGEKDIRRIRPGFGISPKYYNEIIGSVLARDVVRGEPVSWSDIVAP